MNLADERLRELDNPALTADERALLRTQVAADLIHKGRYEDAREALGEHWQGTGVRPSLAGLSEGTAAEMLLQAGVLSGWLGKLKGVQDAAKDLLSESAALFERVGEPDRAATARAEIALCYWREGAYAEARVMLAEAAARIKDDASLKAKTVLRFAIVETSAGRYSNALQLLTGAAQLFDERISHTLRGSFHNELARVLRRLGAAERRQDYVDRAIIEYTAAIYHAEQAQHESYLARIENNLAFLLYTLGRYRDAHEHLDRAQTIFTRLRDSGSLAQVDETRARVLIAERRYRDAERIVAGAVQVLEQGDEAALLAEALTVQGVVWARLWEYKRSITALRRAAELAEAAGACASAGLAVVSLIEEHGGTGRLPSDEVYEAYLRADRLLKDTEDAEALARLRACARIVMKRLTTVQFEDKHFTLPSAVHQFEAKLIARALEETGGSITKAARLLGLTHQTLGSILQSRHKQLWDKRKPPQKRLKSIIKK
ncbi:MAG TPA: helix-turn-helix domain-containing protein [Acidobacteriaceae bacterium]|nr:helix-turn-helix domain-containing protein [Acidobacteriaceae bacterium]